MAEVKTDGITGLLGITIVAIVGTITRLILVDVRSSGVVVVAFRPICNLQVRVVILRTPPKRVITSPLEKVFSRGSGVLVVV